MKVLIAHTRYREPGGEDVVADAEARMLSEAGHDVVRFERDNHELDGMPPFTAATTAIWSRRSARAVAALVARERPDVVHFHNTFPLMSPSVYGAARSGGAGAAVVQTLHNYRMVCPNAMLLRDGRPCTDCVGKPVAWPGVVHGCYRSSRAQSAVVAAMLAANSARGTYRTDVDAYIALTAFARDQMLRGGLPADRLHVKPNFVADDLPEVLPEGDDDPARPFVLFVGRLSPEKGIALLLDAIRHAPDIGLVVIGDGPCTSMVAELASDRTADVRFLGRQDPGQVASWMRRARALVMPSIWYEGCPMTVLEAFCAGTPVIAPRHGAFPGLVDDLHTGWLVEPSHWEALAAAMRRAIADNAEAHEYGVHARAVYERRFTPAVNLEQTLGIYDQAIATRHRAE